jgi:hypothetical protein
MLFRNQCLGLSGTQRAFVVLLVTLTAWCRIGLAQSGSHPGRSGSSTPAFTEVTLAAGITNTHHKPILDHQLEYVEDQRSLERPINTDLSFMDQERSAL